jgi:hypothetical protein
VQRWNADPVALLDPAHAWPKGRDMADALVTGNKGTFWFDRPVSPGGMQIRTTDAGSLDAHEDFASPRFGDWDFPQDQRLAEALNDSRLHHF